MDNDASVVVVTDELLDAMTGAGGSAADEARRAAESAYRSLDAPGRCRGLAARLAACAGTGRFSSVTLRRASLAAVLLRREISNLSRAPESLSGLVGPLFALYDDRGGARVDRRALGHCLAEICLTASLSGDEALRGRVLTDVLSRIGASCAAGDVPSLALLSDVASRAPVAFWTTVVGGDAAGAEELGRALGDAVGQTTGGDALAATADAVFSAGTAAETTERASARAATAGTTAAGAEAEHALYSRASDLVSSPTHRDPLTDLRPDSFAARLGRSCLPPLLSLTTSLNDDDQLRRMVTHLNDCATKASSLVAGHLETSRAVTTFCLTVAQSPAKDDEDLRLPALEVLATLCENTSGHPTLDASSALYSQNHVANVTDLCLDMLVEGVSDDDDWAARPLAFDEDDLYDDADAVANHAGNLMERFLRTIGGMPRVFSRVSAMLAPDQDWRRRRAGLAAAERCASASPVSFTSYADVAAAGVVAAVSDVAAPPRVRWQALVALGALCVDRPFPEALPTVVDAVARDDHDRVVARACSALAALCRERPDDADVDAAVRAHLGDALAALVRGPLSRFADAPALAARAAATVACAVERVGDAAAPRYRDLVPALLACARAPGDDDDARRLRGAAIEVASIVGQAVCGDNHDEEGLRLFAPDAEAIMSLALPVLRAPDEGEALVPFDQLLAACARIATVTKEKFVPFLPALVPHLLRRGAREADVVVTDGSEDALGASQEGVFEQDGDNECVTLSVPGVGVKKLTMNTTHIQEKAQAARAVYELASALGVHFAPHVEECAKVFVPLVNFKYSSEVRSTSAQAMAPVFHSLCQHAASSDRNLSQTSAIATLLRSVLSTLVPSITSELVATCEDDEEDMEVVYAYAEALCEVMHSAYATTASDGSRIAFLLTLEEASRIVDPLVRTVISSCLKRRSGYLRSNVRSEDDKQDLRDLLEREAELLKEIVNTVGFFLKGFGPAFGPLFDGVLAPAFQPFLTADKSVDDQARLAAVCMFDDCVEHCGKEVAAKYARPLLETVLAGMGDVEDTSFRTSCAYGIVQIARYVPEAIPTDVARNVVQQMALLVHNHQTAEAEKQHDDDDDDDPLRVLTENAISAVATMCLFVDSPFRDVDGVDKAALLNLFIEALPLEQDDSEAKICHEGLCDLIDAGIIDIKKSTPILIRIIGDILNLVMDGEDVATSDTCTRFSKILQRMQQHVDSSKTQ